MEVRTWKLFTAFLCCIGFLLALSRAQEEGSETLLREAVVKFGDFFVLNCSSSSSSSSINSSCNIQEESSLNYDYADEGPTWKAFTFIVDKWTFHASCFVNCTNGEMSHQQTIITVYQPPESVELFPVPEMEVGKPYNLTCQVSGVAPIWNLTVILWKGAEQLRVQSYENDFEYREAVSVVVNHTIIAQPNDHNKRVTCQTSLDLRPRGPLLKNTSHSISLWIFGATENISKETASPQNRTVTQGDPVWLSDRLTTDSLINWSPSTSPKIERAMEETYQPLVQLTLELQKPSPGQSWAYHLICHIIRVHPCYSLNVTFFKGSKRLEWPSSRNCSWDKVINTSFTLPVILHPEDHGQTAYCHAAVHFSLHEPTYQAKSSELSLKTAESYLAIIVAATAAGVLLVSVLGVFLIFIIRLWIH